MTNVAAYKEYLFVEAPCNVKFYWQFKIVNRKEFSEQPWWTIPNVIFRNEHHTVH